MTVQDEEAPALVSSASTEAPVMEGHSNGIPAGESRFGGLAGAVEASVNESIDRNLRSLTAPFPVSGATLGDLSTERTRLALADLLEKGIQDSKTPAAEADLEAPSKKQDMYMTVTTLVEKIREDVKIAPDFPDEHSPEAMEGDKNADVAANVLASVLLRSSPESGIDPREVDHRREVFGSNAIADKKLDSFLKLCYEAVQDFVLIMLIVLGVIQIAVELATLEDDEQCTTCWIEGAAILASVGIVVLVTASIDYAKQFAFIRLTRSLNETNTKSVIRDGKQVSVTDDAIVVGDILSVNSHSLASIPADCILLGPLTNLKMDESTLTGESVNVSKKPGDVILSGTTAAEGSGKMVVIAVGKYSVAGKIRARVYDSEDHDGDLEGEDDTSPLFVKLDLIATRIGMMGTVAACVALAGSCIIGFGVDGKSATELTDYVVTAITVLAVAVPEGLPLAVTLALAFSSNKMMKEMNLVKHLDACETMGCATTICTDKTGKCRTHSGHLNFDT